MPSVEAITQQVRAVCEDIAPAQLAGAEEILNHAAEDISGLLGEGTQAEPVTAHIEDAQRHLATAIGHLAEGVSYFEGYLSGLGADAQTSVTAPAAAAPLQHDLQTAVDSHMRSFEREERAAAHNDQLAIATANVSAAMDEEILPAWAIARDVFLEHLTSSNPARLVIGHYTDREEYIIDATWRFLPADFEGSPEDKRAAMTHVTARATIPEAEAAELMDALTYVRQPKQYLLPRRRGPYNTPVVWNNEAGRFEYPQQLLWAGITNQIAQAARQISASGPDVAGTVLDASVDLNEVASGLRKVAQGVDTYGDGAGDIRRELIRTHLSENGDEQRAAAYLQKKYIDDKRREMQNSRKLSGIIGASVPVRHSMFMRDGIEVYESTGW
ncbi:MAG TPA: hypothetical protein VLH86_06555 [Patescibacteria group bacterium]|nr:hypothetical protein [Patescibacteria group bacterium]